MSQIQAPHSPSWLPLSTLKPQFQENLSALDGRDPELASQIAALKPTAEYHFKTQDDLLVLARAGGSGKAMQVLPNPLPAARAREICGKIYPDGKYSQPLLISGLDQGWLWDSIYELPSHSPHAPGMRLPLYLLAGQLERLWAVLHFQNWSRMLSDPRVRLVAGPDAVARFQRLLQAEPRLCSPRMSVTVEPQLWSNGANLDALIEAVNTSSAARLKVLGRELAAAESALDPDELAEQMRHGSLRILGVTSRYTTVHQHSMRDWLAALEAMGHTTHLLIEEADHHVQPATVIAEECKAFRPDLILIINHFRGEMPGLPRRTPCVMWIQDRLPNIFSFAAGTSQEESDYVLGIGRRECTRKWGYPGRRFIPAAAGVNETRFAPHRLTPSESSQYACDAAFIGDGSETPEQIIEQEIERAGTEQARLLLTNIHDRLRGIYDSGDSVTEPGAITTLIEGAMAETEVSGDFQFVSDLILHRVNGAFLRDQTIAWVAGAGVDLRLYGRGWETHSKFSRFARGAAGKQDELSLICQASRVNLQVTPFGSAQQNLFEGLACGGFFLLRSVTSEAIDLLNREVWHFLRRRGVGTAAEMMRRCARDATFRWLVEGIATLAHSSPLADPDWFFAGLEEAALGGFSRSSGTLWPEYEQVSFWSQAELTKKLSYFLASAGERQAIAESMRQQMIRWHTYASISRRMLSFIADDLSGRQPAAIAA